MLIDQVFLSFLKGEVESAIASAVDQGGSSEYSLGQLDVYLSLLYVLESVSLCPGSGLGLTRSAGVVTAMDSIYSYLAEGGRSAFYNKFLVKC